ncbi:T9SS type B sorting domain-containing protein [uncultured Lacinutrix sp.]|uniref:T9SS type B sorting domain-containing protein n=1 Tax=uncultured Lacinutrix sp. TaxID=574032 RepID=UPI002631A922|nr:T9SS type B sorting domain-containing protein [uncultured Lacinutrix sp.]
MEKPTFSKIALIVLILSLGFTSYAQNFEPFIPRFDDDLKGDIVLIGNNILGPNNNAFNNNSAYNHNVEMNYIDIDGDNTTFSSSSADLLIPNPDCYRIKYAGLYWGAVNPGTESITNVKFKGPVGGYNDIQGTIIYDANGNSVDGGNSFSYACYADVTDIVTAFGSVTDLGTYTVANVSSGEGETANFTPYNGTGQSAGWSLFVVYEDPTLPGKSITSFDGFSAISASQNPTADIPINGFRTVPAPAPVRANFAFATLEGDSAITGDQLLLNGVNLSATDRPVNNFFNSSVTQLNALPVNNRIPNSTNTLGFDTGVMVIPNPANSVIANDATSATVRLETSGDTYFQYFFAFAVEIIEPDIVLTKIVEDDAGNDIGGQTVGLGSSLNYVIGFQNIGNDNATNFQIKDILPVNIIFNYPTDLVLPPGVTVASYNVITREIVFDIENYLVEENDPLYEIRIEVQVVDNCNELADACSNIINNQAFATYSGFFNPSFQITDDPSLNSNTGCLLTPQATNFLADLDCEFSQNEILCGSSLELTAADGYDTYSWSTSETGTPVIGTNQTVTVTATGTYYVFNTAIAPCQSISQEFIVELFGGNIENPVIPYADEVVSCPNDGKLLPNIFLCGANDSRDIQTNIAGAASIIWEQLDESSCDAVSNTDCANEDNACVWNQVAIGPNFLANTSGQFRLTINYSGGCFVQFYFNVYQNLLNPTVVATDIICTTPGSITVNNVPSGYEYSLDDINYQASNVFTVNTPGIYNVYIRQINVPTNPCVFSVLNVQIRERDFTVSSVITQPLCYGDKGSIQLAANDVDPQYSYTLSENGTVINSVGPILENTYAFENLNPGTYTATVETENGCIYTEDVTIIEPPLLTVTAAITNPLTCTEGEITVYPQGGTPPYFYFVNSTTDFQTVPEIIVTTGGTYNITVVDSNNCIAETTILIENNPAPEYNITHTDVLCYNDTTAEILVNVTNANGYTLEYSIDNGTTYTTSSTFSNLSGGDYQVIIKYTLDGSECFTTAEAITVNQPDAALTATAGISELAGCGPAGEGVIRITNPQGGTPFPAPNYYEYSFDNQATWTTSNEAYVLPGSYTVYIRDANGCIFVMQDTILDQEPPAPTIEIGETIFNCDGSGNATVTVTNNGGSSYEYDYYLDGTLNPNTTNPETFTNVPSGSHTISVEYTLLTVPTFSNLLYETFGYGVDTTSPGINPTYYCFEQQVAATQCGNTPNIDDGEYTVTSNIEFPFWSWVNPTDYTPATNPVTPNGRYMVVNIGATIPASEVLYEKQINDIIPNQPIQVEFAAMNLLRTGIGEFDPDLRVALVDASGTEIDFYNTGNIPKTENWIEYPTTPITLDPGANTSLKFILRSNVQQVTGNDVAIDDLKVFQLPLACSTVVDFPFIIDSGNAFTADITGTSMVSCSGAADGEITIAVQNFDTTLGFQYSIDNGTTWVTQMTSPYTITGLTDTTYNVQVRYDDTADTCTFSFTETIDTPGPLTISITNTEVTCLDGATITATATEGTPGYSFQLIDTVSPFTVTDFNNGVLTNVPAGTYTVEVTDASNCTASTTLTLDAPIAPTAIISTTSDFCYDTVNESTIEVTASGGVTPYQYNINGGAFQDSNIFSNLTPGAYIVIVRDAFGCEVTLDSETIEPQLLLITEITKDLDCTTSPDAIITGNINGGSAPFTYAVSENGSAYTDLGTTGTPFTYTATAAGTYQFQVTDAQGCITESQVNTIDAISTPTGTANGIDPLCFDDANGEIQLSAAGGSGGFTFSFNGSAFTSTSLYTGLNANTTTATTTEYTYQIQDSNNCLSPIYTITLNNPTQIIANTTLSNNTNCSTTTDITVTATGGTGTYTYSFNGNTSYTATNTLTVTNTTTTQTITYSVRDENGCIVNETIDVPPFNPLTGISFTDSNVITCNNTTTDVTVTPTNGIAPFTFEITAPTAATTNTSGATNGIFTGLTPGDYTFEITDSNGCSISASHTIAPAINIAVAETNTDQTCFGSDNGTATFTMTDVSSLGNYTYTLSPVAGSIIQTDNEVTVTNLPTGTYTFNVVDSTTGCNSSVTITIDPITEITFSANASNVSCNTTISNISFPTLSGGSGGYSYAYVTSGNPAPTNTDYSTSTTVDTSILGLVIDVYVMDSNGCVVMNTITILSDNLPTVTATVDNQCTGTGNNFTITATATGVATLMYSIDATNYQTGNTFTVTTGTYTITVRDGNGCEVTDTITVNPQLTLSAILDKDITCVLPEEAQVTLTATGGDATTYTYAYSTNGGTTYTNMPTNVLNTNTSGSYLFMVTDANSCTVTTITPIEITPAVSPDITVTQTGFINCNGEETGAISITPDTTLGQAPFVFEIFNTTTSTSYGSQTSGLPAGNYTITVTDARGCTEVETIIIAQPDAIIVNHSTVPITCDTTNGISQGSVIVDSVSGGTGPYNYFVTGTNGYNEVELNNIGDTSTTFDVVDFGLYQINVVDTNGCSVLIQDVLVASPPDDLDININTTADCTIGGEAVVTVNTALAGSGPFYFDIYNGTIPSPPPGGTWQLETSPGSITFTGLTTGVTYTFIVYDSLTGCTYFETADTPIPTNSTLTVSSESSNNITCTGSADGNVSFTINNPETSAIDVNFEIFDSLSQVTTGVNGNGTVPAGGSLPVTNLGPLPFGNYYVLITETSGANTGCSIVSTSPFNITESAFLLNLTASVSSNENCNDLGVITAIASDGTAPYQYQILLDTDPAPLASSTAWASPNTFTIAANGYTVYAIDAYGCIRDFDVTLIRDAEPTIDAQTAPCYVGTPITVTISGTTTIGSPLYSINGTTFVSNPDFTISSPGTYTLYIQDGNGCVASTPYIVNDQLLLNAALTSALDCTVTPDAEITLTATGGNTTSYSYEVSTDGGTTYSTMASNVYTTSTAGSYTFNVTDASGCTSTTTYVLDPIPTTTFTTAETNVSCNSGSDGSITVTTTSSTGPFAYQLDSGTPQSSNVFNGLSQGTYTITVIDANSCTISSGPITISEPLALTATNSVLATTTCDIETLITVLGQDGTPTPSGEYYYDFNGTGFSTTNTYIVNNNGSIQTINYTVRDANGCEVTGSVTVNPLDSPSDLDFSATAITCLVNTADITLTATGGSSTLTYEIIAPASATANTTGATNGIFTGLTADSYTFQVIDANGCTYQELYVLNDVENINVNGQLISDVTCNPGANGEVLFTVANFEGTYSYSINGGTDVTGQTNSTITVTGLTGASTQTIVVTDEATGCTATTAINVEQSAPLSLVANPFINANCNTGAQVSVTASGGNGSYSYSFVVSGTPAGTYSSSNTAVLDPAVSTTWDVYVQDTNSCVISTPLTITIDTDPIPTGLTVTGSQCPSATNDYSFTVNVATGITPFEYSIGNGFQSSPTFTVNAPGTYNITVQDASGCTNTTTYIIEDPVALTLAAVSPSCSDDDGEITVTGYGGTGNYTYTINPNPSSITLTANVFSGVPSGTYTVTITDTTTLCTKDETVTLDTATPVTFTATSNDVSCNGESNGTITVDLPASNNNPIYTYEITAPIIVAPQNSNIFTGLAAGTYTVQVNSGRGCFATDTITIAEPNIIVVSAPTVSQYICTTDTNAINYASITVTGVTGGSETYTIYEFLESGTVVQSGTSNVYTESDANGGTYTVNVYDDNGCLGTTASAVTINPYIDLDTVDATVDNAITCTNLEDITVTATTTGGTATNLEYTVEDVSGTVTGGIYSETNTTGIFTGLDIGNYIISVTNLDTGCTLETVHYVNNPNTFNLIVDSVVDVTCFDDNNGSVNVTFVDEVVTSTNPDQSGPFNYTIVDNSGTTVDSGTTANAGPVTITGLVGGTYTINATLASSPFCTVSQNFTITRPTETLALTATETSNVTCDNNQGIINAVATGGWGNIEYELTGDATVAYSTNGTFTGLPAGTYTVNVRDAQGCIVSETVILALPTPISATYTASSNTLLCFGDQDATITVSNVTGGQGSNYTYTLNSSSPSVTNSGPQTSNVFNNLAAGTYSVTINDGYNCEATSVNIIINEPTPIQASLVNSSTQPCPIAYELTLSAAGGTGIYTYSDTSNFANILGTFNTSTTIAVTPGTYEYYVRDANGCIAIVSNEITIDTLPELVINLQSDNPTINCAGDNNGSIVATAQGGLGNYTYTLEDNLGNTIATTTDSPASFTDLFAGTYQVNVISDNCITESSTITITEPSDALQVDFEATDITCSGSNNGVLVITATGGTGIIKYAISPQLNQFFETNVFENLSAGTYQFIAQDTQGCYYTDSFTIVDPEPVLIQIVADSLFAETCEGELDGAFSIDITGGSLPYSVSLDDFNGTYTIGTATQTIFNFTDLNGGDHIVYITDAVGCESQWNITFPESVRINPTFEIEYLCENDVLTNTVTVYVDESITDTSVLTYSLDGIGSQTSNIFQNVDSANGAQHFIEVSHIDGCVQYTEFFNIENYQPLSLILIEGDEPGEIIAQTTGGTGDYTYTFNNTNYGSSNEYVVTEAGVYTIIVTDSYGCQAEEKINIELLGPCMSNYFSPNGDGITDTWAPGCVEDFPNLTFDIFDRYGRKVATYKVGQYWDGRYNGTELPTGDYWYVVKTNSSLLDKEYVGHFTLYR